MFIMYTIAYKTVLYHIFEWVMIKCVLLLLNLIMVATCIYVHAEVC